MAAVHTHTHTNARAHTHTHNTARARSVAGEDGECTANKKHRRVSIDGYQDVPHNDEVRMRACVCLCLRV